MFTKLCQGFVFSGPGSHFIIIFFHSKAFYSIPNTILLPVFGFTKVLADIFCIFNDILVP